MIVRSPKATWPYVLIQDRILPREQQTVWTLQHMSLEQEHAMIDGCWKDPVTGEMRRPAVGTDHLRILRTNLVGWASLRDEHGTEIPFEEGVFGGPKDALLERLPLLVREELARAIEAEMRYDPDEVGKSSPPSA